MKFEQRDSTDSEPNVELASIWDQMPADQACGPALTREAARPRFALSINWPLLVISVVLAAAFVGSVVFWHGRPVKRHSASQLARALDAQEKADFKAASDWLSRYVQYVPDDAERIRQLATNVAQTARNRSELERALRLYLAYLELRPRDNKIRAEAAKILLVFNPSQAVEQAETILSRDPRHVDGLRIKAVGMDHSYTRDGSNTGGKLVRVVQAYRALVNQTPGDVDNAYRLATICRQHAEALIDPMRLSPAQLEQLADQVMDRLVTAKPNDVAARMARFEYRLTYHPEQFQDDDTQFDEDLRVVLDQQPDNDIALFAAGAHFAQSEPGDLIHRDRLELARKFLLRAVQAKPKGPQPYLVLAHVSWGLGDHEQALAAVDEGAAQNPNNMALLAARAEFQIGLERFGEARETLDQLDEMLTSLRRIIVSPQQHWELNWREAQLAVLRAQWFIHPNNPDQQITNAAELLDRLTSEPIPLTFSSKIFQDLGVLCASLGKWEDAVNAFKSASAVAPQAVSPRLQLVIALSRVGQVKEAAAECRQLTARNLQPQYERVVWLEYARLLLEAELSKPRSDRLWDQLDAALAQLKRITDNDPETLLLELDSQAVRLGSGDDTTALIDRLRTLENQFEDSDVFWRGAAQLYLRLGRAGDAERAVAKLRQLSHGRAEQSQTAHSLPAESRPHEQASGVSAAAKKFELELRQALNEQRVVDAFRILGDWKRQFPTSVEPKDELLKLTAELAQADEIEQLEEGLLTVEGQSGTLWRFARLERLLRDAAAGSSDSLHEADELARSWIRERPEAVTAQLALAMVSEASGRNSEAIDAYRFVLSRGGHRLEITQKLVALLVLEGRREEAADCIKPLESRQQLGPSLLPLAIELAIQRRQLDEAVELANRAVDLWPNHAEAHVMQGRALLVRAGDGDVRQAEAAFSRAAALAPADVAVLVAAIHFHLASPQPVRTHVLEWYVRRAAALIDAHQCPPEAWHALVVARGLALQGSLEASEAFYRQALRADSRQEGIPQWIPPGALVTMRTSRAKTELTDPVVWAAGRSTYQTLGLLAGVTGTLAASQQNVFLDNDPRLQAIVTLGRAEQDSIQAALHSLEQIPEQLVTPGDHMLMAELGRRQGQAAEMLRHYRAAIEHDPTHDDLRRIADVMLGHSALAEASRALERLERQGASEDSLFSLRLRWLKAQQKTDQMIRLAEDTVRQASGHELRIALANVAADIIASADRMDEARGLLELACRRKPDRDGIVAHWLAKQPGSADEVMKRCADLVSAGQIEQAASLAVVCLLYGTSSDDVAARAEAMVSDLLDNSRVVSPQLLVNLSRLREIQGRIDDAIAMGRKAIGGDSANPAVQNNMAWYLGVYKGNHALALESINQVIRMAGPLDPFLDTKGVVLLAAGYPGQSIPLLELAAAGQISPSTIHLHLAAAYHAAGRIADARVALEIARERQRTVVVPFDRELEKRLDAALKDVKQAG